MVVVAEKQATVADIIDDIAGMLDGLADWSDADTYVTNDNTTGDWYNNGRVYQNTNMGVYVLFYYRDTGNDPLGVRFHISNDWDSTNNHPAGKNNAHSYDPFSGSMGEDYNSSYPYVSNMSNEHDGAFLTIGKGSNFSPGVDYPITYFLSASNKHISAACWNTTDSNNGASGAFSLEHVDNKFWADGVDPFAYCSINHHDDGTRRMECAYGFQHIAGWGSNGASMERPYAVSGFDESEWGRINPDSNDDTFFFSKPVVYLTPNKKFPSALLDYIIKNDNTEGAAHGDTISFNGKDYRCMRQAGAAYNTEVSCLLRYE